VCSIYRLPRNIVNKIHSVACYKKKFIEALAARPCSFKEALIHSVIASDLAFSREHGVAGSNAAKILKRAASSQNT
jgi:hypothetical protein